MAVASLAGLFISSALIEREVIMADGSTALLHFAKAPAVEWSAYQFALAMGEDEATRARASLRLVMVCLREPDGKQALTYEQVLSLDPGVAQRLIVAAAEVSRPAADAGKTLPPGANSGSGTP